MNVKNHIRIREATYEDNDQLIALTRLTPMKGQIEVYEDRSPDFFAKNKLLGEHQVLVAEFDNQIIGCIATSVKEVNYQGSNIRVSYSGDLKVLPEFRRHGIGESLLLAMYRENSKKGLDLSYGVVLQDNKRVESLVRGIGHIQGWTPGGSFYLRQIAPYFNYSLSGRYKIDTPTENDISEIYELIKINYQNHNFFPTMNEEKFRNLLKITPDYGIQNFLVAKKITDRDIVAVINFWDYYQIKRIVVVDFSRLYSYLISVVKILSKVLKPVPLPSENQPFRSIYLKYLACRKGSENGLRDLVKEVLNRTKKQNKYHIVWTAIHESDRKNEIFRGLIGMKIISNLHVYKRNPLIDVCTEDLKKVPAYMDFSLV